MKFRLSIRSPLALVLLVAFASLLPSRALAYIDPGTGSFLIQGLIAAVVGAGVAIRVFWSRIRRIFTGQDAPQDPDDDV